MKYYDNLLGLSHFIISSLISCILVIGLSGTAYSASIKASVFALQPFGGIDNNGNISGIIPEIIEEIQKETGLDIDIKVVPYKRMFQELATGKADFSIFFRTHESEKIALPKAKVYTLKNVVVGKSQLTLTAYTDLSNHTIALPNGTFYNEKFDNDANLKKIFVPGFSNAVNLLLMGRVDLVAGPEISIAYHLKKNASANETLGRPYVLSHTSAWFQVSAKSKNLTPDTLFKLVMAVNKLRNNKTIDKIVHKYK